MFAAGSDATWCGPPPVLSACGLGTSAGGRFPLFDELGNLELLPFVRIEHVVAYKEIAARPKDIEHLRLVRVYREREV